MNLRLASVSRTELVKRFRQLGWEGPRSGKNHDLMVKGSRKVPIPNRHKRKDVEVSLLAIILREAGISRDE